MAKPMTVAKQLRRVAQVRAGQTTIEEASPASPLEQLDQIDALIAAPDPIAYSAVVRESGWAEIVKARLVELEEKSAALGERIGKGAKAITRYEDDHDKAAPIEWRETFKALIEELADVDEAHRNLLWQYQRQMGSRGD